MSRLPFCRTHNTNEEPWCITESENSVGDEFLLPADRPPLSPVSEATETPLDDEELDYILSALEAPPPPDGGWGWVIVFASFMCNLIVDGIAYTFGIFMPEFQMYYQEGKMKTAWVGSLLTGVYLSAGPVVSALTNKFGCRKVCIAGSIIGCIAFALSTLSPSVDVLMLVYGVLGGIGFGCIYLPAVVCVGYYFDTKRALATGIAVCGSGVGTFIFAPFAAYLLEIMDWQNANLILAGIILNCAVFGALMRPLEKPQIQSVTPLLLRMAEEKRFQMERGSIAGSSYFMVKLPDGTMERRPKIPLNIDPGVHSSFNLDQLVPGSPLTPVPTMVTLPTITEARPTDGVSGSSGSNEGSGDIKSEKDKDGNDLDDENDDDDEEVDLRTSLADAVKEREELLARRHPRMRNDSEPANTGSQYNARSPTKPIRIPTKTVSGLPRNGSTPQFTIGGGSLPKNTSVPLFDRMITEPRQRRSSYRGPPTAHSTSAKTTLAINNSADLRKFSLQLRASNSSFMGGSRTNNNMSCDDMNDVLSFTSSGVGAVKEKREIVRPLSRKDIFYSGSIVNLPEFQSQKSLQSYRQSMLHLPRIQTNATDFVDTELGDEKPGACGSWAGAFCDTFNQMMDLSLLKNPVFVAIGISNIFGMLGFYVPFVYLMDSAKLKGIAPEQAAFLLSIIGITNTVGRVGCGWISDMPWVNSLLLNNFCILLSGFCVFSVPFCFSYTAYSIMAVLFGLFVSGYISLTSIILVDLLGLDNLTNAFGLLILFRGSASIIGPPLAGAVYDATNSYDVPFYLAGSFLFISAIISFMVPCIKRLTDPKLPMISSYTNGDAKTNGMNLMEDIPEDVETNVQSPLTSPIEDIKEEVDQVESAL